MGVHRGVHRRVEHAHHEERERRAPPTSRRARSPSSEAASPCPRPSATRPLPNRAMSSAGEAAREQAADRQRRDGGAQLRVRQGEGVLDRGQPRQDRRGDRAVREEQHADGEPGGAGARRREGGGHGRPMVPDAPGAGPVARRTGAGPVLSSPRCLSSPRSRPSRATSAATCCPMAAGPARRSPARASRGPGPCATRTRRRSSAGVTGRRIEAIGRRGKQVVVDLSGGAFLTDPPQDDRAAVRGRRRRLPVDPYERLALALDDGREIRFRDVRKFGRIGLYVADDDPFDGIGPEPLDPRFTLKVVPRRGSAAGARGSSRCSSTRAFVAGVGNIYADEALWRSRLHPLRSARSLRPADERALYRNIRRDPRRGRRAPRQLDRRLHGPRRRRRDAGAPRRLPAHGRGVPALRPADPADRGRDPGDALLLVVPAAARGPASRGGEAARDDDAASRRAGDGRTGRRWVELDGDGALGRTSDEAAEARASDRRARRPRRRPAGRRRVPGPARGAAREPRPPRGRRPRDRHVRHPRPDHRRDRAGRADRPRRPERRRQDDAPADRLRPRRARPRRRGAQARPRRSGCSARRRTSTRRSWPRPTCGRPSATAPRTSSGWRPSSSALEHAGHAAGTGYADLQHRFDILGGYTLDQRVDEALSGLGFARDEWLRPPTALSGGQQTRAALARLVIADPDLMLLDEPTNHLDIGAIEWLEEHLRRRSGALLVASPRPGVPRRDRDPVWELRDRRLTVFRGDYSAYHRQRVERDERAERGGREPRGRDRARGRARPALPEPAQAREDARARGAAREAQGRRSPRRPKESRRSLRLHGAALAGGPVRSGELVVRVEDLAVGLPAGPRGAGRRTAPTPPSPSPSPGRRSSPRSAASGSASSGPNGAGKTTLLRTIAGDLPPLDGIVAFGHQVAPGVPRPAARRRDPGRHGPRRDPRGDPGDAGRGARLPRPVPVPRRRRRSRRSGRSRAASGRASSSRCSGSCRRTCCSSTSRRTTSTSRRARRSRRSSPSRRRRSSSCPTTGGCSRRSARSCGSSTTGWPSRSTAATAPGARPWPTGWTVRGRGAAPGAPAPAGRHGRQHAPAPRRTRPAHGDGAAPHDGTRRRRGAAPRPRRSPGARPARSCPRTRIAGGARCSTRSSAASGLRKSQLELAMGDPVGRRELRGDAPGHERARRRRARPRRGRGRVAGARGAGAVTAGGAGGRCGSGSRGPSAAASPRSRAWLAELGVHVVDADEVARAVTAPGPPDPRRSCSGAGRGAAGPDGTLDRAALGRLVFADPAALRDLEALVHPAVRPRILAAIAAAEARRRARRSSSRRSSSSRAASPACATRSGSSPATRPPSGRGWSAAARRAEDAEQRIAAQAGLAARLAPARDARPRHERARRRRRGRRSSTPCGEAIAERR